MNSKVSGFQTARQLPSPAYDCSGDPFQLVMYVLEVHCIMAVIRIADYALV
jgi:hypothetical protein